MSYNEDLEWEPLAQYLEAGLENFHQALEDMKKRYDRWQSYRAGRTNADLAAVFGVRVSGETTQESDVADMDAAYAVGADGDNFLNNGDVATSDRWFSMRKFMKPSA